MIAWVLKLATSRATPWLVALILAAAGAGTYLWEHSTVLERDVTIATLKKNASDLAAMQVEKANEDKANASKSRVTIENRNRSADYPTLVDKLR